MDELTWIEISKSALKQNIQQLRKIIGPKTILCPCVKGNAYGHDLKLTSKILLEGGADWLAVNSIYEAQILHKDGISAPIYVLGYVPLSSLKEAVNLNLRIVVYDKETIEVLSKLKGKIKIHLKVETGNNRQGILMDDIVNFAKFAGNFKNIEIEGISTHFANIEDTTDHSYAFLQLERFKKAISLLKASKIDIPIRHCANSASTILFPKTHFDLVRPGIATYGMWPSNETFISYQEESKKNIKLSPALTWKTKIAQIKEIPTGEYIGYGCTFKTGHKTRLAILPIGYYDGYSRAITGGYVLIKGKRAPIRGRICMNIIIVEITDIPDVKLEDEVVLLGSDGNEKITAEQIANWENTINYEVTTRINERIPRILV